MNHDRDTPLKGEAAQPEVHEIQTELSGFPGYICATYLGNSPNKLSPCLNRWTIPYYGPS